MTSEPHHSREHEGRPASPTGARSPTAAYAGIGARETPIEVLRLMREAAEALAKKGAVMRSGMSPGADRAFYEGALAGGGLIELYLPWQGFSSAARSPEEQSGRVQEHPSPTRAAYALAESLQHDWQGLDERARHLLARNCHQVLGDNLEDPVKLVICWTPDGDRDGAGPKAGRTGLALRLASSREIEILNLRRPQDAERLSQRLRVRSRACSSPRSTPRHRASD